MKAIINKNIEPGRYYYELPVFESNPTSKISFISGLKSDRFILHIDVEDDFKSLYIGPYEGQRDFYMNLFSALVTLNDEQIHSINSLYFKMLDEGNLECGTCCL